VEQLLRWFTKVKHVEVGFNRLSNPPRGMNFPAMMDTLILESNHITSLQILDYLDAPSYFSTSK